VGFDAASVLPVAGLTAFGSLALGGMLLGKRVTATGAAGGVGRLVVQLASPVGADVTAVVGSPQRGTGLTALGANEMPVDFEERCNPFDLILESAGGEPLAAAG